MTPRGRGGRPHLCGFGRRSSKNRSRPSQFLGGEELTETCLCRVRRAQYGLSKIDYSMITGPPRTGGPVRNGVGAQKDGLKPVPGPVDDQVAGLAGAALARSWEAKAPWRRPPQAFTPGAAGASPACLFRGAPPVAPRRRPAVAGFGLNDE